eukprot:7655-Heterococcus_DN1.PRE.2
MIYSVTFVECELHCTGSSSSNIRNAHDRLFGLHATSVDSTLPFAYAIQLTKHHKGQWGYGAGSSTAAGAANSEACPNKALGHVCAQNCSAQNKCPCNCVQCAQ